MTPKRWIIFAASQLIGMLVPLFVNFHADAELVVAAWLLLLPGFAVYYLFHYGVINMLVPGGVTFYVLIAYLVAVPINALFWAKVAAWSTTRRRVASRHKQP